MNEDIVRKLAERALKEVGAPVGWEKHSAAEAGVRAGLEWIKGWAEEEAAEMAAYFPKTFAYRITQLRKLAVKIYCALEYGDHK